MVNASDFKLLVSKIRHVVLLVLITAVVLFVVVANQHRYDGTVSLPGSDIVWKDLKQDDGPGDEITVKGWAWRNAPRVKHWPRMNAPMGTRVVSSIAYVASTSAVSAASREWGKHAPAGETMHKHTPTSPGMSFNNTRNHIQAGDERQKELSFNNVSLPGSDIIWKDLKQEDGPGEEITVKGWAWRNAPMGTGVKHWPWMKASMGTRVKHWPRMNAPMGTRVKHWPRMNAPMGTRVKHWPRMNENLWRINAEPDKNSIKSWLSKKAPSGENTTNNFQQKIASANENHVKHSASSTQETGNKSIRDLSLSERPVEVNRLNGSPKYHENVNFLNELSFMPLYPIACEELFVLMVTVSEKLRFFTLQLLADGIRSLNEHLSSIGQQLGIEYVENHSDLFKRQQLSTVRFVQMPFVRTVCETGFNAGHGTLLYLMASRDVQVYSFDIEDHAYSRQMALYIENLYPGRLHVTWGNSTMTIPDFHDRFPSVTCDLISVVGGQTAKVAYWDFVNFRKMAACRHLVLFHSYPDGQGASWPLRKVWEGKKRSGEVTELVQCQYKTGVHGFSLGRYNGLEQCKYL